ncbi:hypothetical protein REPUB_Repub05bG0126300 [Reevesia pubescens]
MTVSPRRDDEKLEEIQVTLDETNDLLNNYQLMYGSFDLDSWLNQYTSSTYTSSFSVEESNNNPSMGETNSIQEDDSLKQWVDSVDPFLLWDGFILGK